MNMNSVCWWWLGREGDRWVTENGRPDLSVKEKKNIVVRDYNKIVLSI
jgi:hypothetical protein